MKSLIVQFGSGSVPRLPLHENQGIELVVIRRGHLLWTTDGFEESVSPGTVYFTLPGQLHGSAQEFEPGHQWIFVVIAATRPTKNRLELHPELGFSVPEARQITRCLLGSKRHAFRGSAMLGRLVEELIGELRRPGLMHESKVRNLATLALLELYRSIMAETEQAVRQVHGGAEFRVRALIEQLRKQPQDKWTLEDLAKRCRMGRSRLATLFLAITGDTPIQFLNRLRVQAACRMLRETRLPITQVALECGFQSSQYFARIFKRFTGGLDARGYRRRALSGE